MGEPRPRARDLAPYWKGVAIFAGASAGGGAGLLVGSGFAPSIVLGAVAVPMLAALAYCFTISFLAATLVIFFLTTAPQLADVPGFVSARVVMVAVLGLALVTRAVSGKQRTGPTIRVPTPLLLLVGLGVLSAIWSIDRRESISKAGSLALLVAGAGAFARAGYTKRDYLRSLRILASVAALANAAALALTAADASGRYAGLFSNPNHLGLQSGLLFPVAFGSTFTLTSLRARIWYAGIASTLALEGVLSGSRGGLVAMAAAFIFVVFPRRRQDLTLPRVISAAAPAILSTILVMLGTESHILVNDNSPRQALWSVFPVLFSEAPILGHGFATTASALAPAIYLSGSLEPVGSELHNGYLNVLSDLGLVGGATFIWLMALTLRTLWGADREVAGLVIAGLASATFESWFFGLGEGFSLVFWFSMLSLVGSPRRAAIAEVGSVHHPLHLGLRLAEST